MSEYISRTLKNVQLNIQQVKKIMNLTLLMENSNAELFTQTLPYIVYTHLYLLTIFIFIQNAVKKFM